MFHAPDLTRASLPDAGRIAALLARAFQDDPLMCFAIPDARRRRTLLPWLIGLNVRYGCRYGEVYATSGYEGAAVWLPPGRTMMTLWRMLRAGMLAAPLKLPWPILRRLSSVGTYMAALHEHCIPEPHWYLSQIGVEPSCWRQGIGSRLLRPMLSRIDAAALPCYLETEREESVTFYQRHGFQVAAEGAAPHGGPHIWAMLRPLHGGDG